MNYNKVRSIGVAMEIIGIMTFQIYTYAESGDVALLTARCSRKRHLILETRRD